MDDIQRIRVRDWLNRFMDRWPEHFRKFFNEIKDTNCFYITILGQYLQWTQPDKQDADEIWSLIYSLEDEINKKSSIHPVTIEQVRYKVEIEDITDGKL